jgi:predicted MFS family arabinose efflux permease
VLGGYIAARLNWRWAFYAVVAPGLLLALWAMLMRDPPRGGTDLATPPRRAEWRDYLLLFDTPSYLLNTLGMTAMTFAIGALAFWMPAYLVHQRVGPLFGMGPVMLFGAITALAGLFGTLAGGIAGDALRRRFRGAYFLVSALGILISGPSLLAFLGTPFPAAWIFVFLTVFFLFFNTGPTNAILANVTHPAIRASGFALNILVIHALGDAISPPIVGAIADRWGLPIGFVAVSAFMGLGGMFWLWGARHLDRDTQLAPLRLRSGQ